MLIRHLLVTIVSSVRVRGVSSFGCVWHVASFYADVSYWYVVSSSSLYILVGLFLHLGSKKKCEEPKRWIHEILLEGGVFKCHVFDHTVGELRAKGKQRVLTV